MLGFYSLCIDQLLYNIHDAVGGGASGDILACILFIFCLAVPCVAILGFVWFALAVAKEAIKILWRLLRSSK